jgi:glycosyltransferase involved in cell wall biosynthesis
MPFLRDSVESILAQTFRDFELLAIDDGSSDESSVYLRGLTDARVRYHRLDHKGQVTAMNYGLTVARAPLIARMDSDDVAYPNRLAKQIHFLADHPRCALLGCQFDCIDDLGYITGRGQHPQSDPAIRWRMLFACPFLHPGSMYRGETVLSVGGYREEAAPAEDYDLWTRMACQGELANHPGVLLKYRLHAQSISVRHSLRQVENSSLIAGRYAASLGLDGQVFRELHLLLSQGSEPSSFTLETLTTAFDAARRLLGDGRGTPMPELDYMVRSTEEQFRWRCLEMVERQPFRLRRVWQWLQAAKRFDPERGTVCSMLTRRLKSVFRLPGEAAAGHSS